MRRRPPGFLISLVVVSLFSVGDSTALAIPGVVIDPHGPAGTEYAIPLDQARRDFGGGGSGDGGGGGSSATVGGQAAKPQLFGTGIRATATSAPPTRVRRVADRHPATPPDAGALKAAANPVSATATSAGIVAGVAILGLGFGALMRLRRRQDP